MKPGVDRGIDSGPRARRGRLRGELVDARGFEPREVYCFPADLQSAPAPYGLMHPVKLGALGGTRTPNILLLRQARLPIASQGRIRPPRCAGAGGAGWPDATPACAFTLTWNPVARGGTAIIDFYFRFNKTSPRVRPGPRLIAQCGPDSNRRSPGARAQRPYHLPS